MDGNKVNIRATMRQTKELVEQGARDDAIELLKASNTLEENGRTEARLVKIRHLMFDEIAKPEPVQTWPKPVRDLFPGLKGLP